MRILFLWGMFLACALAVQAETDSLRILFIGNSYTYYYDLPEKVQKLASHVNPDNSIKIVYEAYTPGGCTLRRHLQNKEELMAIKKGIWDYVVLQEQSSAPAKPTETVAKETYPYARQLDSLVHVYNPQAKVIYYMTWGHKDGCLHKMDHYPIVNTYQGMQERLIISYLEMTYQNNGWCAPVGMAWKEMRKARPFNTLYWPDGTHPSELGTYLAANVIWATIYQKPYQSTFLDGLDAELAEYVQQLAQKTVYQNRSLLNLDVVH